MINDSILIVDDKEEVLRSLKIMLQGSTQYPISTLSDPLEVLDFIQEHSPDLVLLDLNMPTLSGQDLLKEISEAYPEVFVIIITATNELSRAVECVKEGAYDYFVKPVDHERLVNTIHKALEAKRMSEELSSIQKHLSNKTKRHNGFKSILTTNKLMLKLFRYMEAISK